MRSLPVSSEEGPLAKAPNLLIHRPFSRSRSQRVTSIRSVRESIISVAGLIGRPVYIQNGAEIGSLVDFVARWSEDSDYPPVTGVVVKVGRRLTFLDFERVATIEPNRIELKKSKVDLRDFKRRKGEVLLAKDVLDHQLVDVDGIKVIRAADLYLARVLGRIRLVGVDISFSSLLRRIGPARFRIRPTPESVVDWASIAPFDGVGRDLKLRDSSGGIERLRPADLADLLENLGRAERQSLLEVLDTEVAADALEEMEADELETLLRQSEPEMAAELVAQMEPDEAVDALRDLDDSEREGLLAHMDRDKSDQLNALLGFEEDSAGGAMTTLLVLGSTDETVAQIRERLKEVGDHGSDVDGVVVVDESGILLGDLALFEILVATDDQTLGELLGDDVANGFVEPDASLLEVAQMLMESRRASILVCAAGVPLGRILADDVVEALLPGRGRSVFPRLLR